MTGISLWDDNLIKIDNRCNQYNNSHYSIVNIKLTNEIKMIVNWFVINNKIFHFTMNIILQLF